MAKIRVTVWGENVHERSNPVVQGIYPDGMHNCIAAALNTDPGITATTTTLQEPEHGMTAARLAETDVAFHEIIYQASDNKRLNQVLNNLREQMYRYRVEYLKEEQTRNLLVSEHEELVKAIREGDVQKAQDISFHHLENQRKAIIRTIRAENEAKEAEKKE